MDQRDAGRLKRYLSTTCALVSARAHRLRMSQHESSRALPTHPLYRSQLIRAGAQPFFASYLSLDSRSAQQSNSNWHPLGLSKGFTRKSLTLPRSYAISLRLTKKPRAPETTLSTCKQHSQLALATASPRLQSSYITALFRCPVHASQLPAYNLASPPRSAEQTVPVIAEKPSWSQTALSPDPASIGFIADFCRSQGDTRHFHSHKHHLRGYLHHEI